MDDLYDAVDVVLAPLAFSTGLKIKVGEALSRGKALVSHAHAFEGYLATHPFHECADFEAMIQQAGFVRTRVEKILGGAVNIHSGWKV